ncbi:MAG TPA: DMT family transporter [Magnetovibrio sp.]
MTQPSPESSPSHASTPAPPSPVLAQAQPLDMALLVLLGVIWGASFSAIKVAVATIPPMTIAGGRIFLGALIVLVAVRLMGKVLPRDPRTLGLIFLTALFNCALPFFLIAWGEQTVDSAVAALLMGAGPLLALGLAHVTTKDEKLTPFKVLGTLMGLGGVLWVVGPAALHAHAGTFWGQMAIISAAAAYAVSGAIARHIHGVSNVALTALVLVFASALTVPLSLILDRPWTLTPSTDSVLALLYLGTLPTAGAFLIRYFILKRAGYAFASLTSYVVTVCGVIWGAVFLAEPITPVMFAALGLVLGGVALTRVRFKMRSGT